MTIIGLKCYAKKHNFGTRLILLSFKEVQLLAVHNHFTTLGDEVTPSIYNHTVVDKIKSIFRQLLAIFTPTCVPSYSSDVKSKVVE